MTIFAIRDESRKMPDGSDATVGFLFYIDRAKRFYAELPSDLGKWDVPAMFYGQVGRRNHSIDHELALKWVRQRIVPAERQNISSILRDNNLKEYDEYRLLVLSAGRCAQDDQYIVRAGYEDLPDEIRLRLETNVRDIMTLSGRTTVVFFCDGSARTIDISRLTEEDIAFKTVLDKDDVFHRVKVSPGGFGIEWDRDRFIGARRLYTSGKMSEILYDDVLRFAKSRLSDTSAAMSKLGVSRQYVDQLVKQDKLHPVISRPGTRVFTSAEMETGLF